MKDPLNYVRPNILALKPYSTARDEFEGGDISVWLDANENPYNNGVNRYPDPHQRELKRLVADLKGVDSDMIFLGGAGSDEAIDLTFRIFCEPGIDNVVSIAPTYGVYSVAAATNNVEVREVMLDNDYGLPVDRVLAAVDDKTKLIWICSPNNPTGNAFPLDAILEIADRFDGILVVDEAYVDFSAKGSMLAHIMERPNIIVLQTFSKAWAMASLRVGMAFAVPSVAAIYARVKYPYNMNGPTQREIARRIKSGVGRQVAEIVDERCKLASALASISSVVKVYPSDANFLLVKVTDADAIYKYLIEREIIVRNRTRVKGCENCLRVTVGTPAENRRVVEGFKAYGRGDDNFALHRADERRAVVDRKTKETDIHIEVDLDRPGEADIATGLDFFDHMLEQIAHHGSIGLTVKCVGDINVDEHHSMEDVAIALGDALAAALGSKRGIERYGFVLPMDDCRAMVLIDLGGRAELRWNVDFTREYVGDTPTEMYRHFFHSLSVAMKANIHVEASGENNHHLVEGVFKAFARALKMAVRREPFSYHLPSSKGMI